MSVLKANSLSNLAGTKSVSTDTVVDGSAKAWANFSGVTTPAALREGFNISSLTDNGVGDYTLGYMTVMPSVNYGATTGFVPPDAANGYFLGGFGGGSGVAAGSFRAQSRYGSGGVAVDITHGTLTVHSK